MSNPGYFYTPEDEQQEAALQRQRAYAQALLQSKNNSPTTAYSGLANAGNQILGAILAKRTDAKERDLTKSSQDSYQKALGQFLGGSLPGVNAPANNAAPAPSGPQMAQALGGGQPQQSSAPPPMSMRALLGTHNPALINQLAPQLMQQQFAAQTKANEPYTLAPGQHRFAGGQEIASAPERNNPNQPFNADGTPNKAFQDYENTKLKTQQAPQWANVDLAKRRLDAVESGKIDPDSISFMAQQVLAGDKSPFQNLGRGTQGAQNIAALRGEVMHQAKARGLGGADLAALNAEFAGLQAGERTLGTRTANIEMAAAETQNLIPMALAASKAVPRSQYPSLNKIQLAIQQGTGDENVVKLGVAVNGLVNTYARAISPTGNPTVSDKDHAREILDKAWSNGQFDAAVGQMEKEIAAARKSPGSVRGEFRSAISGGRPGVAAVPDAPSSMSPAPQQQQKVYHYDANGNRLP